MFEGDSKYNSSQRTSYKEGCYKLWISKKVSFEVTVKAPSLFMFQQVYCNVFVIYS